MPSTPSIHCPPSHTIPTFTTFSLLFSSLILLKLLLPSYPSFDSLSFSSSSTPFPSSLTLRPSPFLFSLFSIFILSSCPCSSSAPPVVFSLLSLCSTPSCYSTFYPISAPLIYLFLIPPPYTHLLLLLSLVFHLLLTSNFSTITHIPP